MTLLITEAEVERLLDMPTAMEAVEEVFGFQGQGRAQNVPRRRAMGDKGVLHMMSAAISPLDRIGFKAYVTGPSGARFVINLYRESSGELDAIVEAGRLGQIRTGAASGVSAKYLAREAAASLAIIGSGYQARTQLEAIALARELSHVRVYSRDERNRSGFAAEMSMRLGLEIEPVGDAESACRDADIIVTATSSRTPVLMGSWIGAGTHVVAMGANRIQSRELDDAAVAGFDLIAVDDVEQAKIESGDLSAAVEHEVLVWDNFAHMGAIVAGSAPGRSSDEDKTLFKSLGVAIWDIAVAHRVYEKARREGLGTDIPMFER